MLIEKPDIVAIGCTLIWKPGTKEEIDECSTFFKDKAQLRSDVDNSGVSLKSLNDKYGGRYCVFK